MKDTLIKIKNNLKGNNSGVDEAENEINDLEHKEATFPPAKKKKIQKNTKTKESKKMRIVKQTLGQLQHSCHRGARRRRERARNQESI